MTNDTRRVQGAEASVWRSAARRDQLIAVAVAVVLLLVATLLQPVLKGRREKIIDDPRARDQDATLRNLTVEFPRLTLGGFRGLLAMVLWINAEEAKNERQWMRLETAYNYIGVLQPYFVTVWVFHGWNQAYNLSAQWHDPDNKYKWVLDGLDYLYVGESYNPGAADLQLEQANMYFLKIGGSFERIFYRAHWRSDLSQLYLLETAKKVDQSDATVALKHVRDICEKQPQFNIVLLEDPAQRTSMRGYGIGIRRFIEEGKDEPVLNRRYGVSPYYFAYREYKRTLANPTPPTTTSLRVIHAWPAMSLRLWCRDDIYYSTRKVGDLFVGKDLAEVSRQEGYDDAMRELRDCYENVTRYVADKAIVNFEAHLKVYPDNAPIHNKHMAETRYYKALADAESAMLEALDGLARREWRLSEGSREQLAVAQTKYRAADKAAEEWINTLFPGDLRDNPDREDYEKYRRSLQRRIDGVAALAEVLSGRADSGAKPDLRFLRDETVER